jgi:hypothetical protein
MSSGFPELDDLYGLSEAPAEPVHAPSWPVYAAVAAAIGSAVALVWASDNDIVAGLVGYVLGALATPLLTVTYRLLRRTARKDPYYVPRLTLERVLSTATSAGIVLGVVHAWFVATELAKR